MKKAAALMICIIILVALCSCGIGSNKLSDTWAFTSEESAFPYYNIITFYSDGTCSATVSALGYTVSYNCEYVLDKNQIKISTDNEIMLEGKLTKKSNSLTIEGLDKTRTLLKLNSFDKKPSKKITEQDITDWSKEGALSSLYQLESVDIGEIEHKDKKYYCTVKYKLSGVYGGEKEETFIWVPGLNRWCRQGTSLSDLYKGMQ